MPGYRGYRRVPKKIEIIGDVVKGKTFIGIANSQLKILEQQMSYQNLKQSHRTIKVQGIVIECWSCFNLQGIKITVTGGGGKKGDTYNLCYCNCHLAHGYIINNRVSCYEPFDYSYSNYSPTYDVEVCNREDHYVLITEALPLFGRPFYDGEKVLVLFEPDDINDPYIVGKQGCDMIKARITTLFDKEKRYKVFNGQR